MSPSVAVVCTTISDGIFLGHYVKALKDADATMYVIPDRNTPQELYWGVAIGRNHGMKTECPDPDEQVAWLAKIGAPEDFFPWRTDHRRNVGYLMAYESGADIVISVDDDNLPEPLWLTGHGAALTSTHDETETVSVSTGFWNPLNLVGHTPGSVYPRGYPYGRRTLPGLIDTGKYEWDTGPADVSINAGLWFGDPDVDAITRIALRPRTVELEDDGAILAPDTWAPVNSQNTAVRREVIPAYYFFRSPRFGDIYQGYLAQACAKHLGHSVRFGTPVVRHERNEHDLLRDLEKELPDIMRLDSWLDWLMAVKPEGSTYAEAYESLAVQLLDRGQGDQDVSMSVQMRQWLTLCRRVDGSL